LEESSGEHDEAIADLDERVSTLEGTDPPDPNPEPPPIGSDEIPSIPWTAVPADWINVKSNGAKGDGTTDDTAAIQSCLNKLTCFAGTQATVYLPAGTYKITGTLTQNYKEGSALIGHGRDTVLEWHGADNGCIYNSDSNAFSLVEGIVFDGRGKASNGLKHGNTQRRVIMHMTRHCHFKDFRAEAIHIPDAKPDQKYVAESMIDNVLIERCKIGITMLQHNDYINSVNAVTFLDCEIGVKAHYGLPLIRNCHFDDSRHFFAPRRRPRLEERLSRRHRGLPHRGLDEHGRGDHLLFPRPDLHLRLDLQGQTLGRKADYLDGERGRLQSAAPPLPMHD
jgi:hypothetical protein